MKFPYEVMHDGILYGIGEDVPVEQKEIRKDNDEAKPKTEENTKKVESVIETRKAFNYTKEEVTNMKQSELQSLAKKYGYDDTLKAVQLKKLFITEFNL